MREEKNENTSSDMIFPRAHLQGRQRMKVMLLTFAFFNYTQSDGTPTSTIFCNLQWPVVPGNWKCLLKLIEMCFLDKNDGS